MAKSCQISAVKKAINPKKRINGRARTSTVSEAASCDANLAPAQRTTDSRPKPMNSHARPTRARLSSAVTSALTAWPPKISGSTDGSRTKTDSSTTPTRPGRVRNG
jgi:hypothetical protein